MILWRELLGPVLRAARKDDLLTLRQVAERSGISFNYLSEVERGEKDCSSEMLEAVCGALNLSYNDLLVELSYRLDEEQSSSMAR